MLGIIKQPFLHCARKSPSEQKNPKIETKDNATNIVLEIGSHQVDYPLSKSISGHLH